MDNAPSSNLPLVVIIGPTASGKTALAIKIAKMVGGEIICADSRTIYKEMNIGTAKPTRTEQEEVPHWGIDLVEPGQPFSVADFKRYAEQKIIEIRARGHIPFLVGGTGLYIDSVIFDYQFGPPADLKERARLETFSVYELQNYCKENNIPLPENNKNKRYLVRAIEQKNINHKRNSRPITTSIIVGIATNKTELLARIQLRAEQLFNHGVVEEAIKLGKKYGWSSEAMTGNAYQIANAYLEKEMTKEEAIEKNTTLDWKLAKRQITWFNRNPYIKWLSLTDAETYLIGELVNE